MSLKKNILKDFKHIVSDDFEIDIPVGWIDTVYIMMHEIKKTYKKTHAISILREPAIYQITKIFTNHGILRIKTNKKYAPYYEIAEHYAKSATNHCEVCHTIVQNKKMNKTKGIFLCENHIGRYLDSKTKGKNNEEDQVPSPNIYSFDTGCL